MRWNAIRVPKVRRRVIKRFAWFPKYLWASGYERYEFVWLEKYSVEQEWVFGKWEDVNHDVVYDVEY